MTAAQRRDLAAMDSEILDGFAPVEGLNQPAARRTVRRGFRLVALVIACAMFMEQLDATVLATALPTMARDFGVPAVNLASALTSYLFALAVFIPASGWLADRFGSRTVFRSAIIVFLVGSLLCAQATALPFLVFARFVQGAGGAMMIPVGRLVLLRSVAKEDMVSATSWLVTPALIGPILGPPLGGYIITYLNWRWIFYLNLPIGLLGVILVTLFFDNPRGGKSARFDFAGFLISGVSLGCLLFGFEMTSRSGQIVPALGLLAVGLAAGLAYIAYAHRRVGPILDLTLLRAPTFRLSLIGGSLTRITQGAQPFLLPMMLQLAFGMTAAVSGTITIAGAIGSLLMKGLVRRILRRFGFRTSLIYGGLLAAASYAVCALFRPGWPAPAIFCTLVASGFFMSFQFTAYNTIAYDEIPAHRMSDATSFYATFQQLLLSLGICVGAIALHIGMLIHGHATPGFPEFTLAFAVVTAISAAATIWNRRFARDAGAELSGHKVCR